LTGTVCHFIGFFFKDEPDSVHHFCRRDGLDGYVIAEHSSAVECFADVFVVVEGDSLNPRAGRRVNSIWKKEGGGAEVTILAIGHRYYL